MQKRKKREIGFSDISNFITRNKRIIAFFAILGVVIALVINFKLPNIYQSNSSIDITPAQRDAPRDILDLASGTVSNLSDEIIIIKSRHNILKTLENLDIGTRYFIKGRLRNTEFYKDSPFTVQTEFIAPKIRDYMFELTPISKEEFRLVIKPGLMTSILTKAHSLFSSSSHDTKLIHYDRVHRYNSQISTPWFILTVKQNYQLTARRYAFTISPDEQMLKFIQKNLDASYLSKKGTILELTYDDTIPLRAKEILAAIEHTYLSEKLKLKSKSAQGKLDFIDTQLETINLALEKAASRLEEYKANHVIVNMGSQAALTSQKLSELESSLYEQETSKSILENILSYIQTHNDIGGIDVNFKQQNYADSAVKSIIAEIQKVHTQKTTLLLNRTQSHPEVNNLNKQLASLKKSLEASIRSSLRNLTMRISTLKETIKKRKKELQKLPIQEKRLATLTRDYMVNEKIYDYLLEKRAETTIIESSTVSQVSVLNPPILPTKPIKPKRLLLIVAGLILGTVVGMTVAAARKYLHTTIRTTENIEALTSIPVYGTLPILDKNSRPFYDAFLSALWTNIAFLGGRDKSKLITFTSTISGEGKTTTVCELGENIAEGNKKVILVDLDMRKSSLHERYKLSNTTGISNLLAGHTSLDKAIKHTKHANLDVITSGPIPTNPTGLIMSGTLEPLIATLLEMYDYVLLDSPAIGLVADAKILLYISDITFVVLKADYSKKEFIENINRMNDDPDVNLGIILNGIDFSTNDSHGYGHVSPYSSDYYDYTPPTLSALATLSALPEKIEAMISKKKLESSKRKSTKEIEASSSNEPVAEESSGKTKTAEKPTKPTKPSGKKKIPKISRRRGKEKIKKEMSHLIEKPEPKVQIPAKPKEKKSEVKKFPPVKYHDFDTSHLLDMGLSQKDVDIFTLELIGHINHLTPKIETALKNEEYETIEQLIRSIKESSMILGKDGVSAVSNDFYTYMKTGRDKEIIAAHIKNLKKYLARLKK